MAKSINQVTIMGNLTRDPEIKQLPSGQSVTNFSLALNRSYKDQNDQWQEAVSYVDVAAWGKLAEQSFDALSRGKRALVQGRLESRQWKNAEGKPVNKLELVATDITFVPQEQKTQDVVLEDIDDKPLDLSSIPDF